MLSIGKYRRGYKVLSLLLAILILLPMLNFPLSLTGSTAAAEVDNNPPSVSITSPTEGTLSGVVGVSVYASDESGVTNVEYYIDGTKVGESTDAPYVYDWDTIAFGNGEHRVQAKAYDIANNVGLSNEVTVSVDNITNNIDDDTNAPSVEITSPANNSTVRNNVNFSVYASDNVAVTNVEFYIDGLKVGEDTAAPYVYNWDTSNADGNHNLVAKAFDATGNAGTSSYINVTVDNSGGSDITPPVITASPSGGIYGSTVSVTLTANENASIYYTLDGTEPNIASSLYTGPLTISSSQTLKFIGQDTAGNISSIKTEVYTIDDIAPTVGLTSPLNGTGVNGNVEITANASDDSGIANVEFFIDGVKVAEESVAPYVYNWDTSSTALGNHILSAKAFDTVGNSGISSGVEVNVLPPDTTAPVVSASTPGGTYNAPVTVALLANESADIYYTLDGSNPTNASTMYSSPITISQSRTLKILAQDTSGNLSQVKTEQYIIDIEGPAVVIVNPVNGSPVNGVQNVQVNASDNTGIDRIDLFIDDILKKTASSSSLTYDWDTAIYSDGSHIVSAVVYDAVSNIGSASSTVYIDRAVPVISIANVTTSATTATITWTTNEPCDSQVTWGPYINSTNLNLIYTTPLKSELVTTHSVTVTGLNPNSYYNFRILTKDRAGNLSSYDKKFIQTVRIVAPYVRQWLINGPHENTQTSVLGTDYLNGEGEVRPYERQVQSGKTWAKLVSLTDSIDISTIYYQGQYGAYAHTYIQSDVDKDVLLSLGGQSGYRAYLNGALCIDRPKTAQEGYTTDTVSVHLNAGWNRLLVKVSDLGGVAKFDLRLALENNGAAVPGLIYQLDDPDRGSQPTDIIAPTISNITVSGSPGTNTIKWLTPDEASDTKVLYGLTDTYGSTANASARVINHSITLNVEADRLYHYQVISTDAFGNVAVSLDMTFKSDSGTAPYIRKLLLNGRYTDADPLSRLSTDYLGGESAAEPIDGEGTASAGASWKAKDASGDYIDLSQEFGTNPNTIVYASFYIRNTVGSNDSNHLLWLGSTGGIKAWVNETVILNKDVTRPHKFGDDRVPIVLKPGLNRVLLKLTPGNDGEFGFSARVAYSNGNSLFGTCVEKFTRVSNPVVTKLPSGEWAEVFWTEKLLWVGSESGLYIRNSYGNNKAWYPNKLVVLNGSSPSLTRRGTNIVLTYKKTVNSVSQVFVQTLADGSAQWSNPIQLTTGTASVYYNQVYTDPKDNQTYVFFSYDDGALWYKVSGNLLDWSQSVRVGRNVGKLSGVTKPLFGVVRQSEGNWAVVWYDTTTYNEFQGVANNYNYPVIKYAKSDDLQIWDNPSELTKPWSERVSIGATTLNLSEDDTGTLFVASSSYISSTDTRGHFKYSTDGGNTWSYRSLISTDYSNNSGYFHPALATDSNGQMYAFYSIVKSSTPDKYTMKQVPIPNRNFGPITYDNVFGFQPGDEGDGINPATGNYTYGSTDLTIPGRGIPLTIERSYNSLDNTNGPFGYGWNFNYNVKLTTDSLGNATITSGDGRRDKFNKQNDGSTDYYVPWQGVYGSLKKNSDNTWKLTQMDRNVLNFNSQGRLTSMVDPNGNTTSLTYDTQGRLSTVTDATGRKLLFAYNTNGYILTITTSIPNFETWTLTYSYTDGDLTGYTEPDGHQWIYNYFPGTHRIQNITDPNGNYYVRLTYNSEGKIETQLDAEGRNMLLTYGVGKTDITDNSAQRTKYFDDKFNLLKQEDSDGTTSYDYDLYSNLIGITDPKGNSTKYSYNPDGMLVKAVDPEGNISTNKYNSYGDLLQQVDPKGTKVVNTYDEKGNLKTSNNGGSLLTYNYNSYGQLVSSIDAENHITTYEYDPYNYGYLYKTVTDSVYNLNEATYDRIGRMMTHKNGKGLTQYDYYSKSTNLKTVTDGRNNVTAFEYDNNHNLVNETNPLGKTKNYTYNKINQVKTATDEANNTLTYEYDIFGNQTVTTDALGNDSIKLYDDNGRLQSYTDFNGNTTAYTYDSAGNQKTVTDPAGGVTEYFYNSSYQVIKVKDPNGNYSEITYDPAGLVKTQKNGAGNTIEYSYDDWGRVTAVKDGKRNAVTYTYDMLGRTKRIIYPDTSFIEYEYDPAGNIKSVRDQIGRFTQYDYDQYNRLAKMVDNLGNTVSQTYDLAGNKESTTVTTPDGKVFSSTDIYDELNRVSSRTEPGNFVTRIEYYDNDKVKSVQDPKLNKTSYIYDKLNRVTTVTNAANDVVNFEYDKEGNRTKVIDGNGKITTFIYDKANRLISVQDAVYSTDPLHHQTLYTYDLNGNLKTVTNGRGYTTTYDYDGANRVSKVTDSLNNVTKYERDIDGLVYQVTDPNINTVIFDYDNMNRVKRIRYPDGKTVEFEFDSIGNKTKLTDQTGTINYTYDKGRLDTTSYTRNGLSEKFVYDSLGNVTKVDVLKSGQSIYSNQYTYNERNLVEQITDANGRNYSFGYDLNGNLTSIKYPNLTLAAFDYDPANRVKNVTNSVYGGGTFLTYDYLYDHSGRRMQMTVNGSDITRYGYDDIGQLVQVIDSRGTTTYDYDGAGNRTQIIGPGGTVNYTYDAGNRLTNVGNISYSYDNNGNRTSKTDTAGTTTYIYDFDNRLTRISTPSDTVSYAYDGLGTLLSRESSVSGAVYYFNNGLNTLMESGTDDFSNLTKFTVGLGGLLGQINPDSTAQYFYYDALGNVGAILNQSNGIDSSYQYDAWGAVIGQTGLDINRTFIGRYGVTQEPEDGLYHMGVRFYDPLTGVFLQVDPVKGSIDSPLSMVPYIYSLNDPANLIDPTGQAPVYFNGLYTGVETKNVKGINVASLNQWSYAVGGKLDKNLKRDAKGTYVTVKFNGREYSFYHHDWYKENGKIQLSARNFAKALKLRVDWSGLGSQQKIKLFSPGTSKNTGIPVTTGSVLTSKSGNFNYDTKISKQMVKRGWNEQMIDEALNNPTRTVKTADTRFSPNGTQNFEPATAYYNKNGGYVVRNNATKNIVQVSDINDPDWKAPWDDDDKGGGSGGGGSDITILDGVTYVKNANGDWEPIGFSPIPIGGGTFPIRVPVGEPIPVPVF